MSKYNYNKDYFSKVDTPDKAYWLGFLCADGCINRLYKNDKLKAMTLELSLCEQDKGHLEKFAKSINTNVPIKKKISHCGDKSYTSYRITICCTKMCYDLISLGCTPQKTYNLRLPNEKQVPKEFIRDYLRGFFDGDGCIFRHNRIALTLTGTSGMLNDISDFLYSNKIITKRVTVKKDYRRYNTYEFRLYGNNCYWFLNYIYRDSDIYLDRKYQKYFETYNEPLNDIHGIYFDKRIGKYIITIGCDYSKNTVGVTDDINKAIQLRKEAEYEQNLNELKLPS